MAVESSTTQQGGWEVPQLSSSEDSEEEEEDNEQEEIKHTGTPLHITLIDRLIFILFDTDNYTNLTEENRSEQNHNHISCDTHDNNNTTNTTSHNINNPRPPNHNGVMVLNTNSIEKKNAENYHNTQSGEDNREGGIKTKENGKMNIENDIQTPL